MRHQNQRRAFSAIQFQQQFHHPRTGGRIQIARRLIRQNHRRPQHKRPCQRHTLLLSSRKLDRIMMHPFFQPDACQQFLRPRFSIVRGMQFVWKQNILQRRQRRDQLIGLKNKSKFGGANMCQRILAQID